MLDEQVHYDDVIDGDSRIADKPSNGGIHSVLSHDMCRLCHCTLTQFTESPPGHASRGCVNLKRNPLA